MTTAACRHLTNEKEMVLLLSSESRLQTYLRTCKPILDNPVYNDLIRGYN